MYSKDAGKVRINLFRRLILCVGLFWLPQFNSFGFCDTYVPFDDRIEFSYSGSTTALVTAQPQECCEVLIWTRLRPNKTERIVDSNLFTRLGVEGEIRLLGRQKLEYRPTFVRVAENVIAYIDFYGSNRNWLNHNPAVTIFSVDGEKKLELSLDKLVDASDFSTNTSRIHWLSDAWFTTNEDGLFIMPSFVSIESANRFVCKFIELEKGSVLTIVDILEVYEKTGDIYRPKLMDLAARTSSLELLPVAERVFKDKSTSLNSRVHAAAYLLRTRRDDNARVYLEEIANTFGDSVQSRKVLGRHQWIEAETLPNQADDPVTFACRAIGVISGRKGR